MIVQALAFYLFSGIMVAAGFMVIAARSPVHSVLFLILAFFNAAGLFVLLGAEYLAMILVIVYVGAVAVLFMFVVMMLDVDFAELKEGVLQYLPIGGAIGIILLIEILMVVGGWVITPEALEQLAAPTPAMAEMTNTRALGQVLYTQYSYYFEAAGMILMIAMVGAVVLTLRHREGVKRQSIPDQVTRDPALSLELKDVKPGRGL